MTRLPLKCCGKATAVLAVVDAACDVARLVDTVATLKAELAVTSAAFERRLEVVDALADHMQHCGGNMSEELLDTSLRAYIDLVEDARRPAGSVASVSGRPSAVRRSKGLTCRSRPCTNT